MDSYIVVTNVWNEDLNVPFNQLRRQSVQPKAWFIIDDGSTREYSGIRWDMSREWNVPIYYFRTLETKQKPDLMTIGRAWNVILGLIQKVQADYLVTLDADVHLHEFYFEHLMTSFRDHPSQGAVCGHIRGEPRYDYMPAGCAKMIRKHIFDNIREMWDLASDTFLNIKSLAAGFENRILYDYIAEVVLLRASAKRTGVDLGRRLKYCGASWLAALYKTIRLHNVDIIRGFRAQQDQTDDPDIRHYYSKRRIFKCLL